MNMRWIVCFCLLGAHIGYSADIRFETAREYEEYFEKELSSRRSYILSGMERGVSNYLYALVQEDKTNQITGVIAKATHLSVDSVREYTYRPIFIICTHLASYIQSKTYRRLSDIVEELNEKAMATREPTWFERLTATLTGYVALPAVSGGSTATAETKETPPSLAAAPRGFHSPVAPPKTKAN